jgi:FtsH-binding integral membrane protein
MSRCKNFIAKTLAHVAGGLAITSISARYPVVYNALLSSTGVWAFLILGFLQIGLLFAITIAPPNTIYKYSIWFLFVYFIGQLLSSYVHTIENDNLLIRSLALTTGIFFAMMLLGFYDSQNILGFRSYLFAGLIGYILVELILDFLIYTKTVDGQMLNRVLSGIGVGLFAFLTGSDIQLLKEKAKKCNDSPDYIDQSLNLFLDFINIFNKVSNLQR